MTLTIWQKYFLKQTLKTFLLFLFCFYGLYVLVDLSAHASSYHQHIHFRLGETLLYYASEFLKRAEVLVPFGLLLATIKTLCGLNINNELVALLASGYSLKTLLRPFIYLSLAFVSLLYVNTEFLQPHALQIIKRIDDRHHSQKVKVRDVPAVQHIALEDESTLLFQKYDAARQVFFDTYWIKNQGDIYRIKYLHPYTEYPVGQFVDHFTRNAEGRLVQKTSAVIRIFPEIKFNNAALMDTITPTKDLSISDLHKKFPEHTSIANEKHAQIMSYFYYKMAMPWLCLLAVIGPAPFCIRFTRQLPVFFIYAFSIFGLVGCYLVLDAALILGERQAVPPLLAIGAPLTLFFAIFGLKYVRLS